MSIARVLWPLVFWVPLGFTTYMALTPLQHAAVPQANDKMMHLLAFGYLTGAFSVVYAHWATWQRTAGIMLVYGVLIEVAQGFIPTRFSSGADLVADSAGIALALMGLAVMKKVASSRVARE